MNNLKDISTLMSKNYPEVNFILWISFIASSYLNSYFINFLDIIFQFLPEFLQNYFLNIHISDKMFRQLYIFILIIFLISLVMYFWGDYVYISFIALFFTLESEESKFSPFFEKFILLLSPTLLILHILNIIVIIQGQIDFNSSIGIKEFPFAIGIFCAGFCGFIATSLIQPNKKLR